MVVFIFQKVQEEHEIKGWTAHHEQEIEFEEHEDGSPVVVTLSIAEPDSSEDKWEIQAINPQPVRNFST